MFTFKGKKHLSDFALLIGIIIIIALAFFASFKYETILNGTGNASPLALDGWIYEDEAIELPFSLDVKDGETVTIKRALSAEEKLHSRYILTVKSRYASLRVWADDELIYEGAIGEAHALSTMYHFIPLSDCENADILTLEFIPYGSSFYTIEPILLDTAGSIQHQLALQNIFQLLFSLVAFVLTAIMLGITIVLLFWKTELYKQSLSFALFLFLSGIWVLLDSKITTINGGNYAFSYFFSYAAYYLLTAPFLYYIRFMSNGFKKSLSIMIWAVIINTIISFVLHISGIMMIRNTSIFTNILVVLSIPLSTMAMRQSVKEDKESNLKYTFFGVIGVYLFGLGAIFLYYTRQLAALEIVHLFAIGVNLLTFGMAIDMISSFGKFLKNKDEADHYKRLATRDTMTDLGNRNAYELNIESLIQDNPSEVAIVAFDMDNLKLINDNLGHHIGDQAIYTAAVCIKRAFNRDADCYRVGGDEFVAVLVDKSVNKLEALIEDYKKEVEKRWDRSLPSKGLSYGFAKASFDSDNPLDSDKFINLRKEADISLYRQKEAKKLRTI